MSYDVRLCDPETGDTLHMAESFTDGGTYPMGGTTACDFNITYNYAEVFDGLVRELHERSVADTIEGLRAFVALWPDAMPFKDYWAPTPGNAKAAIVRLISFADAHPHGKWEVS